MYNLNNQMRAIGGFFKANNYVIWNYVIWMKNFNVFYSWLHINEYVAIFILYASERKFHFQFFFTGYTKNSNSLQCAAFCLIVNLFDYGLWNE